jgi:hypothetical protein
MTAAEPKDEMMRVKSSVKKLVESMKLVPEESFNNCVKRVFNEYCKMKKDQFIKEMLEIDKKGTFIPWEEAKKQLGIED